LVHIAALNTTISKDNKYQGGKRGEADCVDQTVSGINSIANGIN
jgi:hypothetical protein